MSEHANWVTVGALDDLPAPGNLTFKHEDRQLAIVRTDDGTVFAIDNRCPHEGYPLAQGDVKGCVLTCAWHNWKFDLRDGRCTLGGEDVRTYETRIADGSIHVDLSDPPADAVIPGLLESLSVALFKRDSGRAIRDGVRLLQAGHRPVDLLADIARDDALRAEYGTTHTLAVAADCARYLDDLDGPDAMYAIAPVIDLCGESNARLPRRERRAPVAGATREAFVDAVENEHADLAEAMIRGALDERPRTEVEGWLYDAMALHFTDFGHQLIYLVKAQELLDACDGRHAADILGALAYSTTLATREDTLPYMEPYFSRLAAVEDRLPALRENGAKTTHDPAALRDAVLEGRMGEAFDALWRELERGVDPEAIAATLVGAAAHRFYRFDRELEVRDDVQENWLWATHRFTFSAAVRHAVVRHRSPEALRFLVQAVAFINSGHRMDLDADDRHVPDPAAGSPSAIMDAIVRRDTPAAIDAAAALAAGGDEGVRDLERAIGRLCLDDPLVRPIVLAHAIKTSIAAFEEYEALAGHPDRVWTLLAAVRFLASPVRERRIKPMVTTSIRWVVDGVVPRKLTQ